MTATSPSWGKLDRRTPDLPSKRTPDTCYPGWRSFSLAVCGIVSFSALFAVSSYFSLKFRVMRLQQISTKGASVKSIKGASVKSIKVVQRSSALPTTSALPTVRCGVRGDINSSAFDVNCADKIHMEHCSVEIARKILSGKRLLLIGDSTTRRIFWEICYWVQERSFFDHHLHTRASCPDERHHLNRTREKFNISSQWNITLEFEWAESVNKLRMQMDKLSKMHAAPFDYVITSIFHHEVKFWENPNSWTAAVMRNESLTYASRIWKFLTDANETWLPQQKFILMTPHLLGQNWQFSRAAANKAILGYVADIQDRALREPLAPVNVVDGTSWMLASPKSFNRNGCLGTDSRGIHLETEFAHRILVEQLLWVITSG